MLLLPPAAPLGAGGGLAPGNVLHMGQALSRPVGESCGPRGKRQLKEPGQI